MDPETFWNKFSELSGITVAYQAWSFGVEADALAALVLQGEKTATASAYPLYEVEKEALPKVDEYSVILNSQQEAVCIVKNTKVSIRSFDEVSENHAFKEGEGDKSLTYWRKIHQQLFTEWLAEADLVFTEKMPVVCEEFEVVYPE
ncbi:ASCH domain-containing protein [Enterococcus olivae]